MSRTAVATRSERPVVRSRKSKLADFPFRLPPKTDNSLTAQRNLFAERYQQLRGLVSETWQIARWLLVKCIAQTIYLTRGRNEQTELSVIRIGNRIFQQTFSLERFSDFDSYLSHTECGLKQYFEILPAAVWLERKQVLDVGSGLGQYSNALLVHGAKTVVGLEYQAEKSRWAAARFVDPQLEFVVGSAECMPFPDESFDTIFSHTVFEHIRNVEAALAEVRRVLKPSGQILLSYNFFHHRGGHHLFPYIHFPWATWVIREATLCRYWSGQLARDQRQGGMRFFPTDSALLSLSDGAEIHLNKLTFEEFETLLPLAGLRIVRRNPSEDIIRAIPLLNRIPRLRRFLTGSVYYVLQRAE